MKVSSINCVCAMALHIFKLMYLRVVDDVIYEFGCPFMNVSALL